MEIKSTDNWIAKANYSDKKKSKLWISAYLQNTNNYLEEEELYERLNASVLFVNNEFSEIVWIAYNGKILIDYDNVDNKLKDMIVTSAINKAKEYMS